jgi:predicted outer membrane protein
VIARPQRWLMAALAGVAVGFLVPTSASAAPPAAPPGLSAMTATDVMLLNGVRLAGLWEMPAGTMAAEKGKLPRVREIGAEIARQHVRLDELVTEAANQLGVKIPDEPTAEQKGWLQEMSDSSGARFDKIFVDRLRAAHGRIFPVIGSVRSGTRNEVIRKLAIQANRFVSDHMDMLESTGLVQYVDLPPAAVPPPQDEGLFAKAKASTGVDSRINPTTALMVLAGALVLGAFMTMRILRWRLAGPSGQKARAASVR